MSLKSIFFILIIAALAGGAWYKWGRTPEVAVAPQKPPVLVRLADVERRDIPMESEAVGTVVPTESVAVRARLDSQIKEVKFRDGDYVKKGDLLFVLDDSALSAQLRGQEANLARDRSQMENLERQYSRNQQLVKNDYASAAELDDSKAAYDAQKATVNATGAAAQNLKVQIEYTKIKAPISGRTGTINVTAGNNVKANDTQPLVTINQVKPIRVQFSLPQTTLGAIREAMKSSDVDILIKQDAGKEPLHGKLEYIDNAVDQQTNTFIVRALFDNPDETLWPGMFVNATIKLGEEAQVLTVPEEAIQHGQDQDFVFVIANDVAKRTAVKIARLQSGIAVIESGLKDGDRVAIDGLLTISDGASVKIVERNEDNKKAEEDEQKQERSDNSK